MAQENASEKYAAEFMEVRQLISRDLHILIVQEMNLPVADNPDFWETYNAYRARMSEAETLRIKVISDFSDHQGNLTEAIANQILDDYFRFRETITQIRKSYRPKFSTILGAVKTARLYQLENKIEATVNYTLATQIPLMQ